MKAVQFDVSAARYAALTLLGSLNRHVFYGPLSCVKLKEIPEPTLPGDDWVKIKTVYGGICGSDLNMIHLHDSPSMSPFASFPFVVGHENVGVVVEAGPQVKNIPIGTRVVADPMLSCVTRGIDPVCPQCAKGEYNLCENFARGNLAPGTLMGACKDTGGSWGEYYVAHVSQVIPIPDGVSDEDAALLDALASGLHPVMRHFPKDTDHVLIVGAGIIGLMVLASIRALGSRARVAVMARYPFQAEAAKHLDADEIITGRGDYFAEIAELTGGTLYQPILGKRVMTGGFDIVFDCVGSSTTIDESLRFTRGGGTYVLVGLASFPKKVDWTPVWFKEIKVCGGYCYTTEEYQGKKMRTYEVGLDLLAHKRFDTAGLITHIFPLEEYRTAIQVAAEKGKHKSIKVLFKP